MGGDQGERMIEAGWLIVAVFVTFGAILFLAPVFMGEEEEEDEWT